MNNKTLKIHLLIVLFTVISCDTNVKKSAEKLVENEPLTNKEEKIYGTWEYTKNNTTVMDDGGTLAIIDEGIVTYMRGGRINGEGTISWEFEYADEEMDEDKRAFITAVFQKFDFEHIGSGSWKVEDNFLISILEDISISIADQDGIEYKNSADLDELGQLRLEQYNDILGRIQNLPKGLSSSEEIITLTKDLMTLKTTNAKDEPSYTNYTRVKK